MCCFDGNEWVNRSFLRCFWKTGRGADDVTRSGRLFHARAAATDKALSPWLGWSVPQLPPNEAIAVTRPPPPGEGHRQGTVVQVHSDSGTPKPPAETWLVPGFATSEGRAAAASRGQTSWICRSDATQRSRQTEVCLASVCLADMQEGRPVSHYHCPPGKWPVTRWATARRVDWRIDWCCVLSQSSKIAKTVRVMCVFIDRSESRWILIFRTYRTSWTRSEPLHPQWFIRDLMLPTRRRTLQNVHLWAAADWTTSIARRHQYTQTRGSEAVQCRTDERSHKSAFFIGVELRPQPVCLN